MPVYPDFGHKGEGGISYTTASAEWRHGQNMSIGYLKMEPGTSSTPHSHADEQFIYILKGTVRLAIDGGIHDASAGDLVHFPPGAVHEIEVAGGETAEFLLSRGPSRQNPNEDVIVPDGAAARSVLGNK